MLDNIYRYVFSSTSADDFGRSHLDRFCSVLVAYDPVLARSSAAPTNLVIGTRRHLNRKQFITGPPVVRKRSPDVTLFSETRLIILALRRW